MNQNLIPHIDRLILQRPASKTALASFRELTLFMVQITPDVKPIHVGNAATTIRKKEGSPLFSREHLPVDFIAASVLFKKFLKHLDTTDRKDAVGIKKALDAAEADIEWAGNLFRVILRQDERALSQIAEGVDLDIKVLFFLSQTALRPPIHALRNALNGEIVKEKWDRGYCPFCGSQPNMASLAKSGKRTLHCELCGEEWAYPRIKCPFCNTVEQERLGYFEAEGEEGFRVYFCRECRRYLKTIDKKAFEKIAPLELENLATIHLDVLAHENGFT